MSESYEQQLTLRASPESIFEAFTTTDGVAGWWSSDVTGSFRAGEAFQVGFGDMDRWTLRMGKTKMPSRVEWGVIDLQRKGDLVGSKIVVTIEPVANDHSRLTFRHEGLTPDLECYDECKSGWDYFMPSIRDLVEKGEGKPWAQRRK